MQAFADVYTVRTLTKVEDNAEQFQREAQAKQRNRELLEVYELDQPCFATSDPKDFYPPFVVAQFDELHPVIVTVDDQVEENP